MPIRWIDCMGRANDEQQHDSHFHKHNHVVHGGGFANADHQQESHDGDDNDRRQIEDGRDLRSVRQGDERPARGRKFGRNVNTYVAQKRNDVARPSNRHGDRTEGIFQNQIPSDDPREKFPERGVAIGVRAAGHRYQRRELAVAECSENRGYARQHE